MSPRPHSAPDSAVIDKTLGLAIPNHTTPLIRSFLSEILELT